MPDAESILQKLLRERPPFHGAGDTATTWQLDDQVLCWLFDNIREGWATLETGCGYSTVAFGVKGARHTVVSPSPREHDRIRAWCAENGVSTDKVTFIADGSQRVLPAMQPDPLDLVLIDGCHAVPYPMIDWFYVAERLKVGGHVIIDDTHLRSGKDLQVFLQSERERWKPHHEFTNSAIFTKLVPNVIEGFEWVHQPYCQTPAVGPWRRMKHSLLMGSINLVKKSEWLTDWLRPIYRARRAKKVQESRVQDT
jgi:predicted O-methyltransferase YrrM